MRLNQIPEHLGEELVSPWVVVDKARIDAFADCTEDHSPVHVDPLAAAAVTGTARIIAHGMLSASLISGLSTTVMDVIERESCLNYGFDKVRFLATIDEGSRVRAVFRIAEAVERKPGQWRVRFDSTLEVEGSDQPAVFAEWLLQMEDFRDPARLDASAEIDAPAA